MKKSTIKLILFFAYTIILIGLTFYLVNANKYIELCIIYLIILFNGYVQYLKYQNKKAMLEIIKQFKESANKK